MILINTIIFSAQHSPEIHITMYDHYYNQARSGLLATGPAGGLGVSHGGGQGDKSVCGVRAAPRKISQFKVLKRPYSAPQVILLRLNSTVPPAARTKVNNVIATTMF